MILLFLLRSGNYGDAVTVETLKDFHRERVQILANSGADLIAFETTPNKIEAKVDAISLSCVPMWNIICLRHFMPHCCPNATCILN